MAALEYHRPKTISEALSLLKQGVPLAGGTILTPNRRGLRAQPSPGGDDRGRDRKGVDGKFPQVARAAICDEPGVVREDAHQREERQVEGGEHVVRPDA